MTQQAIEIYTPELTLDEMAEAADSLLPVLEKAKGVKWGNDYFDKRKFKDMRKFGPYAWVGDNTAISQAPIEMATDLPSWVCVACRMTNDPDTADWGIVEVIRLTKLPSGVIWGAAGWPYEIQLTYTFGNRLTNSTHQYFVTIDDDGVVHPCLYAHTAKKRVKHKHKRGWFDVPTRSVHSYGAVFCADFAEAQSKHGKWTLAQFTQLYINVWKSRQFCWNAIYQSDHARLTFGFDVYEAKRIFKARQDRLTPTGRKRPILHFVTSHYRNLPPKSLLQKFIFFVLRKKVTTTVKTHIRGSHEFYVGEWFVKILQDGKNALNGPTWITDTDDEFKGKGKKAFKSAVYYADPSGAADEQKLEQMGIKVAV
jgi:hypothetical protein|tara:strand:- start:6059 stop:7159 length:1101 start_codon:yes stop_codon:yes gene_type:complete